MTWRGRACLPHRRCRGGLVSSNTAMRKRGTGKWSEALAPAWRLALWPGGLPPRGAVLGLPQQGHDCCGKRTALPE
eukprot:6177705-Pleurochrysis_carterae.AAC.1